MDVEINGLLCVFAVDSLFQENGLNPRGEVQYQQFVDAMITPSPDY